MWLKISFHGRENNIDDKCLQFLCLISPTVQISMFTMTINTVRYFSLEEGENKYSYLFVFPIQFMVNSFLWVSFKKSEKKKIIIIIGRN